MNSRELRLKRLVFATILCVGITITGIAFFLSNYQSGVVTQNPTFLVDRESSYTPNASTRSTLVSEVDFSTVTEIILFSNSWSSLGGRMRNELSSLDQDNEYLGFNYYEASDSIADTFNIQQLPAIILINAEGQEVLRFEAATETNLSLILEEFKIEKAD